jgi:16S rRNA (uracil1498-N3)-methyltransferase
VSDGFFVAELASGLAVGDTVTVTGDEARHAAVVRRVGLGETVTVTNGQGLAATGPVVRLGGVVEVEVASLTSQPVGVPEVVLVQALPKPDRVGQAIDALTQVGADHIVPWQAARSIVVWAGERAENGRAKWARLAREASKQSRRARFPVVASLATTAQVADLVRGADLALVMHERADTPLAARQVAPAGRVVAIIGPEGGLTDQEVDQFLAAGAQACWLGPTVLRTTIAGAVAIAQLRVLWQAQALAAGRRPPGGEAW